MEFWYDSVTLFSKLLCKIWLRAEIRGIDPKLLPKTGPLIIAPMHVTYFDPSVVSSVLWPRRLDFFASQHLYQSRLMSFLLKRLRTHPLIRGNAMQALRQALRMLEEGKTIVIFPEGTRSRSGTIGTVKKGIAMLSEKAKCPVVPISLSGLYDVWPPHKKFPYFFPKKKVVIHIGEPLPPCQPGEDNYEEWLRCLQSSYVQ